MTGTGNTAQPFNSSSTQLASFLRHKGGVSSGRNCSESELLQGDILHERCSDAVYPLQKEFAMAKDITMTTSRASLCALGEYLRRQCFFAPLLEQVQIPQKTVRYRP